MPVRQTHNICTTSANVFDFAQHCVIKMFVLAGMWHVKWHATQDTRILKPHNAKPIATRYMPQKMSFNNLEHRICPITMTNIDQKKNNKNKKRQEITIPLKT